MAGRPKRKALLRRIEEGGGWDEVVFSRVRAGEYMSHIAKSLGVSYDLLRDAIRYGGPEIDEAYQEAKADSADALIESSFEDLDKLDKVRDPTSAEVSRTKLKVDHKKWLAAKRDRSQYGDDPLAAIGVLDLGQLHLAALQSAGAPPRLNAADHDEEIPDADFEELSSI